MAECLFCRIAAGELPTPLVFADEALVAFADIAPCAPVHLLVVPRAHIGSLAATDRRQEPLLGRLLGACRDLAADRGLAAGYRVVINTGQEGGQSVGHLHLHLLGGRRMDWPPG